VTKETSIGQRVSSLCGSYNRPQTYTLCFEVSFTCWAVIKHRNKPTMRVVFYTGLFFE